MNIRRHKAFTFAEVLAAITIVAIVVPVLTELLLLSGEAASVTERHEIATELGERMLNEWVVTGDWETITDKGDFGEEYAGYRWESEVGDWTEATMREVSIRVLFKVRGREHEIRLSTLAAEVPTGTALVD
jgi:hypothetical protein